MTAIARAPRRGSAGRVRRHHSQRLRLARREAGRSARRRLALMLGLLPLASGLMLGSAVAERAPAVTRISSGEAAQTGQSIIIARHDDLAPGLAEVRVASSISATRNGGADQLLAIAPDAATAAVAGQIGPETAPLIWPGGRVTAAGRAARPDRRRLCAGLVVAGRHRRPRRAVAGGGGRRRRRAGRHRAIHRPANDRGRRVGAWRCACLRSRRRIGPSWSACRPKARRPR